MMVINVNKKGFMFIETIIMSTILLVALLIIYNSYTASISQQKMKMNYDTAIGEIKLHYLKKMMINEVGWKCEQENSCSVIDEFLNLYGGETYNRNGYYWMYNGYNYSWLAKTNDVAKIYGIERYLLVGDINKLKQVGFKNSFGNYIKKFEIDNSKYLILAEFVDEDTNVYSYASTKYPHVID